MRRMYDSQGLDMFYVYGSGLKADGGPRSVPNAVKAETEDEGAELNFSKLLNEQMDILSVTV